MPAAAESRDDADQGARQSSASPTTAGSTSITKSTAREFGRITKQDYLRQAQLLRDAQVGGPVLQTVRADGVTTRFDRQTGAFIAFNPNGTIRTFFKPNDGERYYRRQAERAANEAAAPALGPPDVAELRDLIDQWAEFTGDLERKDYTFDLDNWRNDVDVRELILEALPMFSREEMGDHALKLDAADKAFMAGTRASSAASGATARRRRKNGRRRRTGGTSARRCAPTRSSRTSWRRCGSSFEPLLPSS